MGKKATIFFVLDTAGHMKSSMMASLNKGMFEFIESLKYLSSEGKIYEDMSIAVAVIEYNTNANWVLPPTSISEIKWDAVFSGGLCDLGAGIKELESKLNAFLGQDESDTDQDYYPMFIFLLAGYPTDDYWSALNRIQNNLWFKKGVKIAFAIGEEADVDALTEIAGTREAIITSVNLDVFKRLFHFREIYKTKQSNH